jgi:hypothetical protein
MLVRDPDWGRNKTDTSGVVPCVRRCIGDELVGGDAVGFGELVEDVAIRVKRHGRGVTGLARNVEDGGAVVDEQAHEAVA